MKKLVLACALIFNFFSANNGEYDLVIDSEKKLYNTFGNSNLTSVKICNLKIDNRALNHIMDDIIVPHAWWNDSKLRKICFENNDFATVRPAKYRGDFPGCLLCKEELRFDNNIIYWRILGILFGYFADNGHQSCSQGKLVLIDNDLGDKVRNTFGYTDLSFNGIEIKDDTMTKDSANYLGYCFHSKVKFIN